MNVLTNLRWFLFALNIGALLAQALNAQCPAVSGAEQIRIARWIVLKFKLPADARVEIAGISTVEPGCYRKLRLRASEKNRAIPSEIYLSPDGRFVSRELLDTRVDPRQEERDRRRKIEAGLAAPGSPATGPPTARASITVFSDFQCPYCARLAYMLRNDVLPFERGNVRVVFRHFPLQNHTWARAAAEEAACAGEQGSEYFWRFHDFIFEHQQEFTRENLHQRLSEELKRMPGLDAKAFGRCVSEHKAKGAIDRDISAGTQLGVQGTPSVFINAEAIQSVVSPEQIRSLIREINQMGAKDAASSRSPRTRP